MGGGDFSIFPKVLLSSLNEGFFSGRACHCREERLFRDFPSFECTSNHLRARLNFVDNK